MTETRLTACPLDCPDGCSLEVTVDAGRLVAVDAAPPERAANPLTQGFICHKVKHHAQRVYAPERVLTPLVRTGAKGDGRFREAGWDEALDLVAHRVRDALDRHGPASVVPYFYSSSGGKLARRALAPLLWRALGVTKVENTICAATATAAWELTFGDLPGADLHDVVAARLVVVWGANPAVSNTHLLPLITEARKAGAVVVVVDPRRTGVAKRADLHLAVRPGTDVALAMGLAAALDDAGKLDRSFVADHVNGADEYLAACREWTLARAAEVCGLSLDDVERFAALLGSTRPTFLRVGIGMERNRNGGSGIRAVFALAALVGAFGERGAGVHLEALGDPWDGDRLARGVLGGPPPPPARLVNMNEIGRALAPDADPRVEVLFVQGSNPAVTAPHQRAVLAGLARDDLFTVVHEQVLTDTAAYADVVLPATTHFEAADVQLPYGAFVVDRFDAVIDRVGQSRTNDELAAALAPRLGLPAEAFDADPARLLALALDDHVSRPAGRVQFRDVFPSGSDARAQLVVDVPGVDRVPVYLPPPPEAERYPLTLVTPASARTINSMFGEFNAPAAELRVHPDDAAARGLRDGDRARLWNDLASLTVAVVVDATVRPGVVSMPKGLWRRSMAGGLTANALIPDTLSDLAGGAVFNDTRVEVAAVEPSGTAVSPGVEGAPSPVA